MYYSFILTLIWLIYFSCIGVNIATVCFLTKNLQDYKNSYMDDFTPKGWNRFWMGILSLSGPFFMVTIITYVVITKRLQLNKPKLESMQKQIDELIDEKREKEDQLNTMMLRMDDLNRFVEELKAPS